MKTIKPTAINPMMIQAAALFLVEVLETFS
jgi:hypothetical protein